MRVVVDPNVFVAAAVAPAGVTGRVVRAALERRYTPVVCPLLLAELDLVLARPSFRRYFSLGEAREFIASIEGVADVVPDPEDVPALTRDPDDDYLVALAMVAGADLVVSGDADLLDAAGMAVPVVTPRQVLDRLDLMD